jgi:hypothetical protein
MSLNHDEPSTERPTRETGLAALVRESSCVWRERNLVVIRRGHPLPPVCLISGEATTQWIPCLFHWREKAFKPVGGGRIALVFGLLRYYFKHVWKARLDIPMSDALFRKRRIGWVFFALAGLLGVATAAGVLFGQWWIDTMPRGPERERLTHWLIPGVGMGGGVLTTCFGLLSHKLMPMPTQLLKVIRITETHVWLSGAAPSYLAACSSHEMPLSRTDARDVDAS